MEILYWSATWCTPCRTYKPLIERLFSTEFTDMTLIPLDVDTHEGQRLGLQHNIMSVPTLVAADGAKLVGARDEAELRSWLYARRANAGLDHPEVVAAPLDHVEMDIPSALTVRNILEEVFAGKIEPNSGDVESALNFMNTRLSAVLKEDELAIQVTE